MTPRMTLLPPTLRSLRRRSRLRTTLAWLIVALCALPLACAPTGQTPLVMVTDDAIPPQAVIVPGCAEWTDSGIDLVAGQAVTVTAGGRIQIGKLTPTTEVTERDVGPEGTFLYSDSLQGREFPLPAAGSGPAPCFCLIGKVGQGRPFFLGKSRSFTAEQTGRFYLGINDYQVFGNQGHFFVDVSLPTDVQPAEYRTQVPVSAQGGGPAEGCSVVVFYIDGLRPDVVEEMAAMGHIPNLKRHFVDGGTHLCNAFTAFPSDTITSNGTMWTGCFSDRHGLKGQVRFSRHRRNSDSFLEPMGPGRSSRQLAPRGIDKLLHDGEAATVRTLQGDEAEQHWRGTQASSTPAIYDHLQEDGSDWATGILPIMTQSPPMLWTRSLARCLPYLQAQEAWRYIDDANTHYALRHLIAEQRRVTVIWLPETDSVSHKECRGQFGSTRRTIARADRLVGDVTAALAAQGRLECTYLVLVSDHGHLGGQTTHLARFDIAHEVFFHPREINRSHEWVGGGLGMSVRQHRFSNFHKGDTNRQFAFVDGDSDGTARIFLPRCDYRSGNWTGPNRAADLLAYPVSDTAPSVVLLKLSPQAILITTADRGQAVIERRQHEDGRWFYRYTPVEGVTATDDGRVAFQAVAQPQVDPLKLLTRVRPAFLSQFHDEQTWLYVTASSEYPDAVVTLTRHMLWQESIIDQEQEYAPDLVVTARHGWLFGTQSTPGTTHGYPLAESVRATWYISGPNVRRGARVQAPCRLADLTPTLLTLTSTDYDISELDGRPLRNIYETPTDLPAEGVVQTSAESGAQVRSRPRYWRDVDLRAWRTLQYTPIDPYGNLPSSINNPSSGWDLNNIAYNAMTVGDWSIFRLLDDVASPAVPGQTHIDDRLEKLDREAPQRTRRPWIGTGIQALDIPGTAVADYSMTSTGNLHRADMTIDWIQERGNRLDNRLANKRGRRGSRRDDSQRG
ncbi:MAG: alkaline phosphatase family protein [Planctomycetota bacterium]|nr:alkaline phosphatase family protein [Planctomycetota bacterium]